MLSLPLPTTGPGPKGPQRKWQMPLRDYPFRQGLLLGWLSAGLFALFYSAVPGRMMSQADRAVLALSRYSPSVPDRGAEPGECISQISVASPVTKDVEITFEERTFNGSLFDKTVFRQDPSPEVDAAWESLGVNYRPMLIPAEDALAAGIQPDQVRVQPAHGGGYLANLEGLHQLHCLDLLRQATYFNAGYYRRGRRGAWVNSERVLQDHVSHCVDILRQQLQCTVDLGLMGQIWWAAPAEGDEEGHQHQHQHGNRGRLHGHNVRPMPFVDFNTAHKCRNFEEIREWARQRQVPEEPPADFLMPPGEGDRVYERIP